MEEEEKKCEKNKQWNISRDNKKKEKRRGWQKSMT